MGDLAKISKADETYQRDLIKEHQGEMLQFLEKKETLFFLEVVLSYSSNELPKVLEKFKYSDNILKINTKTNNYQGREDARNVNFMQIATIGIKPQLEENKMNRIDGNHRLSVADENTNNQHIQGIITPFCLLLLQQISTKQ